MKLSNLWGLSSFSDFLDNDFILTLTPSVLLDLSYELVLVSNPVQVQDPCGQPEDRVV